MGQIFQFTIPFSIPHNQEEGEPIAGY